MRKCCSKCFGKAKNDSNYSVKTTLNIESEPPETKPRNSHIVDIPLSTSSRSYLFTILESSILFRLVPKSTHQDLVKQFKLLVIEKNKEIQKQDMKLSALYTLNTGEASFLNNGKFVGPCPKSGFISELDFLFDNKRKLSVKTSTRCSIWTIDRNICANLFLDIPQFYIEKLKVALSKSKLMSGFTDLVKVEILKIAFPLEFYEDEVIISHSYETGYFFIISSGKVVLQYGSCEEIIGPGEVFGDLTIFMSGFDGVVAKALEKVEVFAIRVEALQEVAGPEYLVKFFRKIVFNVMTSDEYAQDIPAHLMKKLVESFKFSEIPQGKIVIANNKVLYKKVIVLIHGNIASNTNCFKNQQLIGFYNENHLKIGTGKYICQKNSVIAELSASDLEKIIRCNYETYINEISIQVELRKIPFFSLIDRKYLGNLIKKAELKKYNKDDWIYKEKEFACSLFCVIQGSVGIFEENNFLFRFDISSVFGETCLKLSKRENSAKALNLVVCYEFPKTEFAMLINDFVSDFIEKSVYYFKTVYYDNFILQPPLMTIKGREYCISTSAQGPHKYFIEVINKSKVHDNDSFFLIIDQKCALVQVSHPSLQRFLRTVSNPTQVLFIYEYLEYTTLDWFMSSSPNPSLSRFLILSLCNTLSYLHNKDILHRNICPSNIAIDQQGWVKLVGYKYMKQCKDRSYTTLDTSPAYKAKETLEGSGYLKASESWSLGVILYEMLTGKLPFGIGYRDSPFEMTEKVLNSNLEVPDSVSAEDKEVILLLMNENYKKRIKCKDVLKLQWASAFKIFDGNNIMGKSPLRNLTGGKLFVNCLKFSWRSLSRKNTTGTKVSEAAQEFEWDEYF